MLRITHSVILPVPKHSPHYVMEHTREGCEDKFPLIGIYRGDLG